MDYVDAESEAAAPVAAPGPSAAAVVAAVGAAWDASAAGGAP